MEKQPENAQIRGLPVISRITIDLEAKHVSFGTREAELGVLPFQSLGLLAQGLATAFAPASKAVLPEAVVAATRLAGQEAAAPSDAGREKPRTVTVTGKLKTPPKAGRPDRSGKATSWATLVAHDDATDEGKVYVATFHRHTAAFALANLKAGDQVTVEGYPHDSRDPRRQDTLSVFNLLNYPNKPTRRNEV